MYRSSLVFAVTLLLCLTPCLAWKRALNAPYVQAMGERGTFYVRCIPDQGKGSRGTTTLFRVRKEGDEKLATYPWYSSEGVVLGWSPIKGEVAVMSLQEESEATVEANTVEFSIHLGGKLLHSYTSHDLVALGASVSPAARFAGFRVLYKVLGCIQVPGTNEYDFVVELVGGKKLSFDILTGKLRVP